MIFLRFVSNIWNFGERHGKKTITIWLFNIAMENHNF
jgi:hypothetical protein